MNGVLSGYMIRMCRRALKVVFGFDRWHISSLDQRPYAQDIILYCNKRQTKNSFAEIGCGLGDILRNVRFTERTGMDADRKVLKAAAFLSKIEGQKIQFEVFNFPGSMLRSCYDVITMVNWIHHIEPEILKSKISIYFHQNLNSQGEILIDTVQDKDYRFNHDIQFLIKDLNCSVHRLGEYSRKREVWAIRKTI
jgi:2-polyprenyl-3-methyl-5-hydroxy-6-metoxy-1,4-benzoquinol methylase